MDKKLKVLILEDLPSDAELAKRELKKVLTNCTTTVVDNEKDYVKALDKFNPDLIVSDYQMPTFDGMTALKIRQANYLHIPFVLLTGSINEETAVEIMKAGADDYVIKEHIKRLGPAALGALEKKKIELEKIKTKQELVKSEEFNRTILQSAIDAIITIDSDGLVLSWNKSAERIFGYTELETIGSDLFVIIPAQFRLSHNLGIKRLKKGGKGNVIGTTVEVIATRRDKKEFPIELSLSKWEVSDQTYYTAIIRDITEKKDFINDLMDREDKYRTLTQNLNVGVYRCIPGKGSKFIEANPAQLKILGLKDKSDLERYKVNDFYPDPNEKEKLKNKFESKGFVLNHEMQLRNKEGILFNASISSTAVSDRNGKVIYYDGILEDITNRKNAEIELQKNTELYQNNLKSLNNELIIKEEEIKHNIAISLHDTLGQSLALSTLKLGELKKQTSDVEHNKLLDEITSIVESAIEESKDITYGLSPPVLHEMGLVPAIAWRLEEIEKNNKIKTILLDQSYSLELEKTIELVLYRNINELLQNVLKHSKADQINVLFRNLNDKITITVSDNGIGFDLKVTQNRALQEKKFGLFSIKERISYLGGSFNIETAPKKGTKATIELSL